VALLVVVKMAELQVMVFLVDLGHSLLVVAVLDLMLMATGLVNV
jgi:hypothetical protein